MGFEKKIRHRNICYFQPTNSVLTKSSTLINKKKKKQDVNEFKINGTMCIFERIVLVCYVDFVLFFARTSEHSNLA